MRGHKCGQGERDSADHSGEGTSMQEVGSSSAISPANKKKSAPKSNAFQGKSGKRARSARSVLGGKCVVRE